jgi:hypothetical protein
MLSGSVRECFLCGLFVPRPARAWGAVRVCKKSTGKAINVSVARARWPDGYPSGPTTLAIRVALTRIGAVCVDRLRQAAKRGAGIG